MRKVNKQYFYCDLVTFNVVIFKHIINYYRFKEIKVKIIKIESAK